MRPLFDGRSQRFGLPDSLLVPIAARSVQSLERYVGSVKVSLKGRSRRINALALVPYHWPPHKEETTPLWFHPQAGPFEQRLHPDLQAWVHVDHAAYRKSYLRLDLPPIPSGFVLDHVQNREAVRLRGYTHPYLRLCPVSRRVNTSGGVDTGGEGMEKEHARTISEQSYSRQKAFRESLRCEVIYADPMDLTKMLNIPPGTQVLGGVRRMLKLFYASQDPGRS